MKYSYKEYAEIYEVIKRNSDFKEKLPKEVLEQIKGNAKRTDRVLFNENDEVLNQISRKSLSLIVYLYLKYVEEDTKIKGVIKEELIKNEMKKR